MIQSNEPRDKSFGTSTKVDEPQDKSFGTSTKVDEPQDKSFGTSTLEDEPLKWMNLKINLSALPL